MTLTVPQLPDDADTLTAALAYAAAGWYVLPVDPGTKHPGSVVGKGWPAQSSRDAEHLVSWFAGRSDAIALHVGRSGAIAFDVDDPKALHQVLAEQLVATNPPHQSTRTDVPGRGHYLFTAPPGRDLGNSLGQLGKGWGEIRGRNGIVVVQPSPHTEPGGRYLWLRTGELPVLPEQLAALLPDALAVDDAATDAEVQAFLAEHSCDERPTLLRSQLARFRQHVERGESRHATALGCLVWALKEAAVGMYPARQAHDELRALFLDSLTRDADPRRNGPAEWAGIAAWAVGQVRASDLDEARRLADREAERRDEQQRQSATALAALVDQPALAAVPAAPDEQPTEPHAADASELTPYATELLADPLLFTAVRDQLRQMRAREVVAEVQARRRPKPPPDAGTLEELLARPPSAAWRIEGLLPAAGRMLWSAQRKTGKTTAVNNLARALITGEEFLGRFPTQRLTGRVVVLNYEVTGEQFARWADDVGVPRNRLYVINLRGRRNLLADEQGRAELVDTIRQQEGEVLVVDPFGRAYTGKSQNDSAEVTPWLVRLDEVAEQSGASELVLTAHAGWDGERTRGSSALEDWPDVIVTMTRDPDTDARFLKAEGRDVELDEDKLHFDPRTRRLSLSGAGSRKQVRAVDHLEALVQVVCAVVAEQPGITVNKLREAMRERDVHMQREDANTACRLAVERGRVRREAGPRGSFAHYLTSPVPTGPDQSPGSLVSGPDRSLRAGTTHTTAQQPTGPDSAQATDVGPCALCGQPTTRYGTDGEPLCQACQTT